MTDGTAVESLTVVFLQAQECAGITWEGRFLRRLRLCFFMYGVGDRRLVLMLGKSCVKPVPHSMLCTHFAHTTLQAIKKPPFRVAKNPAGDWLIGHRGDRIRTCDILLPKQARYQTALHPVTSSL